ncbi:Zinc-responsive transcriptional regulator ZAP1 [Cladobotryum mycophilum]|uniref:Zinc-responsive transcriptional regulator ZAP1 n=1 Tax=Cladobotryum mycophilum TaxID=491253 RepID=A0ABR0SGA7_9HYPO
MDPADMELDLLEDILPMHRFPQRWQGTEHLGHESPGMNPQEMIQFTHGTASVFMPNNSAYLQQPQQNYLQQQQQQLNYLMQTDPRRGTYQAPPSGRRNSSNAGQLSSHQQYSLTSSWASTFNYGAPGPSYSAPQSCGIDTNQNGGDDCISIVSCTSDCRVSCPSQCGETSQGVYCNDDACTDQGFCLDESCEDAGQLCTDANCTTADESSPSASRLAISDGDKQAAAALASFGEVQLEPDDFSHLSQNPNFQSLSATPFVCQPDEIPYMDFTGTPSSSLSLHVNSSNANLRDLTNPGNFFASHILEYHNPMRKEGITHPCPIDHGMFHLSRCTLPKAHESVNLNGDAFTHHLNDHPCGYEVENLAQFAHHLFADHNMLQTFDNEATHPLDGISLSQSDLTTPVCQVGEMSAGIQHLSHSTSPVPNLSADASISPSTATLVSTPSSPSEKWSIDLGLREAMDQTSSTHVSPKLELDIKEECVCRWKVSPEAAMCGLRFDNADELHNHGKLAHTTTQIKDDGGFYCLWSGCSRADGFNQRSKLDRHLQTHTGFKPVQCSICGEQLSAKQALIQHMRTHTGEEPWKCTHPGCLRTFKQQSALSLFGVAYATRPLPNHRTLLSIAEPMTKKAGLSAQSAIESVIESIK